MKSDVGRDGNVQGSEAIELGGSDEDIAGITCEFDRSHCGNNREGRERGEERIEGGEERQVDGRWMGDG